MKITYSCKFKRSSAIEVLKIKEIETKIHKKLKVSGSVIDSETCTLKNFMSNFILFLLFENGYWKFFG